MDENDGAGCTEAHLSAPTETDIPKPHPQVHPVCITSAFQDHQRGNSYDKLEMAT